MDDAILGTPLLGDFRLGMWGNAISQWEALKKKCESIGSLDVTRRQLVLGTRDSTTGWRSKSYPESTIKMIVLDKSTSPMMLPAGAYVKLDALGITVDPVSVYDEILTSEGKYYEVKGIQERRLGNCFFRRECDLTHLPLHE